MSKFVAFDDSAIAEIVSGRLYQSVDFGLGQSLVQVARGNHCAQIGARLRVVTDRGGLFIFSSRPPPKPRFLVFDLEQSHAFVGLSDGDALFALQKCLRFAVKWWAGGQGMTWSEKIISSSSKAVIFPFRYQPQPYRLVIEREPWKERLAKRDLSGRFLLVYKAGYERGDSSAEAVENTNFKKVIESYDAAATAARSMAADVALEAGPLTETGLGAAQSGTGSLFRSFDDWMVALTEQQKAFITAPIRHAHRIEGAAGTGKTLSLMLKAVHELRKARSEDRACHIVFITHSEATRASIENVLDVIDAEAGFQHRHREQDDQSLSLRTLSQLCADKLRHAISEAEFIDRDAMGSKEYQRLYIAEAIEEALTNDLPAHSKFMSPAFVELLQRESSWYLAQVFQHEISVLIKGRAAERFDVYRDAAPVKYGLPAVSAADKAFSFAVFKRYRDKLAMTGQFDTDDVVLTAIGQLDTPIWKRRRQREGFDAIFIDETHLFNINELHLFHYFTKGDGSFPIVYSIDKSQAVGDPGWSTAEMEQAVGGVTGADTGREDHPEASVRVATVFRSSPEIVDLALCIVASGATLFTNFENPLAQSTSAFTSQEESLCVSPKYIEAPNEEALVEMAFDRVEQLRTELGCSRADVLICALDEGLVQRMVEFAQDRKRPLKQLVKRGDISAVDQAAAAGMYVVGHADYVGGLEFAAVVLVGIDDGRVPPVQGAQADAARHFLTYAAHNRLYVAVTRAKYRVEVLGESARGISRILAPAVHAGLIQTSA